MSESTRLGVEDDGFVAATRKRWADSKTPEPLSMIVIEYHGQGDAIFGGCADDRALGADSLILDRHERLRQAPAVFPNIESAHAAAKLIRNRRPNSILGIAPSWR